MLSRHGRGALRRTGALDRIVAALHAHCDTELVAARELVAEDAPAAGAVAAVWAQWRRLGLDEWLAKLGADRGAEVLEHAVLAMVANRLVAPSSKRRLPEWIAEDIVSPAGFVPPSLDQYYRALDAVAGAKETERRLYSALTDLTYWTCATPTPSSPPLTRARASFSGRSD